MYVIIIINFLFVFVLDKVNKPWTFLEALVFYSESCININYKKNKFLHLNICQCYCLNLKGWNGPQPFIE